MAEGYLRFYANGQLEINSAGLEAQSLNPFTVKVMEEDNIDMSEHNSKSIDQFRSQHFDYLITVCDEAEKTVPKDIEYEKKVHFSIPDPAFASGTEAEIEAAFLETRETVKRNILKFLGKALSENIEVA